MNKNYEIMTIIKIGTGEKQAKEISSQVQDKIESLGGKVMETNFWGKRKFSYEIKGDVEGYYDVLKVELEGEKMDDLKSYLNLNEDLVRYLISAED